MEQNSKILISKNVKRIREQAKMTREELSLVLGFENSYISKLERQQVNITIQRLDKIANYFNIETIDLLRK